MNKEQAKMLKIGKLFQKAKEVPPIIVAFENKESVEGELAFIDAIAFIANVAFFLFSFLCSNVSLLKVLSFINTLIISVACFFCKLSTYKEIIKIISPIKSKNIEDAHTRIIKLAKWVIMLGWLTFIMIIAFTILIPIFSNSIIWQIWAMRIWAVTTSIIVLVYGALDKTIWVFFNMNNSDIRKLIDKIVN